jgi:Zn-dependent protease with chaperone function
MRRQEYTADRVAAQAYGKSALLQALIASRAVDIGYAEYLPIIVQNIENNRDRHDFYYQFTKHWDNLSVPLRQRSFAKAVASFRSVYDTHPSYQDRYRALEQVDDVSNTESDDRFAYLLLPNAPELGRDLTVRIFEHRHSRV